MAIIYRGRVSGSYQYWNENENIPLGATNITVVNIPVLTASHVDRSVYAPDGISGSLTQLTGSTSYLIAGPNITIVSSSNGPITISSTDGSYITGSVFTNGGAPNALLNGNVLSASNGVWDGLNSVALRHEFHILGLGYDSSLNLNQFAATYLAMTHVDASGLQTAIGLTELSRETTGSYASGSGWDVNVNGDCSVAVTGATDSGNVYWYVQRVKEMGLRSDGTTT